MISHRNVYTPLYPSHMTPRRHMSRAERKKNRTPSTSTESALAQIGVRLLDPKYASLRKDKIIESYTTHAVEDISANGVRTFFFYLAFVLFLMAVAEYKPLKDRVFTAWVVTLAVLSATALFTARAIKTNPKRVIRVASSKPSFTVESWYSYRFTYEHLIPYKIKELARIVENIPNAKLMVHHLNGHVFLVLESTRESGCQKTIYLTEWDRNTPLS